MQKELTLEGEKGFEPAGMMVSGTAIGGDELASTLKRRDR